jgi:anti-anti-sigma factor
MKRHQTAPAASLSTGNEGSALASVATRTRTAFSNEPHTQPASSEATVVLSSVTAWTHTLVLTGELDRASAHALEAEIERLCEEGVTGITLDLRDLTYIDPIGVAVIAFRCGLCRRRGYDFSLIPGSRLIHRAFEQAGVTDLLPFRDDDLAAPQRPALVLSHHLWDGCEQ